MYNNIDAEGYVSKINQSQRLIICCMGSLDKPLKKELYLQKMLFMIQKSLPDLLGNVFDFQKSENGPYSKKVSEDIAFLNTCGLINMRRYVLSSFGKEVYSVIDSEFDDSMRREIRDKKELINGMTEDELLTFVCSVYPEFSEESKVWSGISKDRVKNAASLLKKQKITTSLAAEIAGMDYFDFEDHLKEHGVRWKS